MRIAAPGTLRTSWWGAGMKLAVCLLVSLPLGVRAQDEAGRDPSDTATVADGAFPNTTAGEFTPAKGFDIIRTERGSLNVSFYGLFRYLNQLPAGQTFTDHLGRVRTVKAKHDLNWHRTFVWLTGFFYDKRFRYNISLWSLPTTQQTLLFGNLRYSFSPAFTMAVGLGPNLTNRSLQGSWPFWAGATGRWRKTSCAAAFRPASSSPGCRSILLLHRFREHQLEPARLTAANDARDMAYSASVWWMPTTGEFGPRGGLGDLEEHSKSPPGSACRPAAAARAVTPRSTRPERDANPALRRRVPVRGRRSGQRRHGREAPVRGHLRRRRVQVSRVLVPERILVRRLSDFRATGPLPARDLRSWFPAEALHMVIPRRLI